MSIASPHQCDQPDMADAVRESPDVRAFGASLLRAFSEFAVPWIIPFVLISLWQMGSALGFIAPEILPSPLEVARAAVRLMLSGELPHHILVSFRRALAGFMVGGSLAFILGLANGLSITSQRLTDTTIQMIRNIPNLSLIPLVILWFGIGESAKLFLTSLGVFFPLYINTFHGVRTVDPQLIEMGRSYGMSRFAQFRQIILPSALPSIFVGVRYGLGVMWLTLIVAETLAANAGIGYLATQAREFMLIDVVVVAIIIYALLGKAADSFVRLLERIFLTWHPAFRRG
jgi:sulfonate transport system permease protein